MPPSHNQRKAAHKKKKAKANKNPLSSSSSLPRPRHGETGGGKANSKASKSRHNSPHPAVKQVEKQKQEDHLSGSESSTTTENETKEEQGYIDQVDHRGSNSQKQNEKISPNSGSLDNKLAHGKKKAAAVIEPASVADYLSQPLESLLEEGTHKDEDLGVNTPLIVDSAKPADQVLVEVASQLNNHTNLENMDDLVMPKRHLEHKVVKKNNGSKIKSPNSASKIDGLTSKENEVQKKPVSLDQKASPKSKNNVLQESTSGKCLHCGKRSYDRVNEPKCSEKQPLLDPAPDAGEKTSWKCCCGIFELFSGSGR